MTGGRLHAVASATDIALQRALALARAGGAPRPVTVETPGERAAAGLMAARCLFVVARPCDDAAGTLRARFGLTAAEATLALALKDGETLRAVAARLGVSINTICNQLGAVFDKTGCRRQQNLVRLLARDR